MARILFNNVNLLTGDSPLQEALTLVINGQYIEAVTKEPVASLPGDQVFDLQGMTILPGLINAHYHATYENIGATPIPVGMEAPPALQTLRAARSLKLALHEGFTGVVSGGAPYAIDASCKIAIEQGLIEGPRIMAGSRDLSTTGHCQDSWEWHWGPGSSSQTHIVDGPEGFRRGVREEIKRGADIIKIFATAGHAVPGTLGIMDLGEDELAAAITAAHARKTKVRAHIANKAAILSATRLNIDVVDHGDGLDEECIDAMLERGTFLVPSMYFIYRLLDILEGDVKDHMQADLDQMLSILPTANRSGLNLLLGDDFGGIPLAHGNYAEELVFYVEQAGIPVLDVIRWGTINGARLMNRDHELGLIKPGYLADLLVVDGNPLENIHLLKSDKGLKAVMKDGRFVHQNLDTQQQTAR